MSEDKKTSILPPSQDVNEIAKDRCGAGIFQTGKDDPMLGACDVHDEIFQARHDAMQRVKQVTLALAAALKTNSPNVAFLEAQLEHVKNDPALNITLDEANADFKRVMDYKVEQNPSLRAEIEDSLYDKLVQYLARLWW